MGVLFLQYIFQCRSDRNTALFQTVMPQFCSPTVAGGGGGLLDKSIGRNTFLKRPCTLITTNYEYTSPLSLTRVNQQIFQHYIQWLSVSIFPLLSLTLHHPCFLLLQQPVQSERWGCFPVRLLLRMSPHRQCLNAGCKQRQEHSINRTLVPW